MGARGWTKPHCALYLPRTEWPHSLGLAWARLLVNCARITVTSFRRCPVTRGREGGGKRENTADPQNATDPTRPDPTPSGPPRSRGPPRGAGPPRCAARRGRQGAPCGAGRAGGGAGQPSAEADGQRAAALGAGSGSGPRAERPRGLSVPLRARPLARCMAQLWRWWTRRRLCSASSKVRRAAGRPSRIAGFCSGADCGRLLCG